MLRQKTLLRQGQEDATGRENVKEGVKIRADRTCGYLWAWMSAPDKSSSGFSEILKVSSWSRKRRFSVGMNLQREIEREDALSKQTHTHTERERERARARAHEAESAEPNKQ